MAGKQGRRQQNLSKRSDVKELAAPVEVKFRKQILATDALLDVFGYSTRRDLDQWGMVPGTFGRTTESAAPLRVTDDASLYFDDGTEEFIAMAYSQSARFVRKRDDEKTMSAVDVNSDLRTFFFGCLRFGYLPNGLKFRNVPIDRAFLEHLQKIVGSRDFRCTFLQLHGITLAEGIDPLEVFAAFPNMPFNLRSITVQALIFLVGDNAANGTLLRSFATHGIWDVEYPPSWVDGYFYHELPPMLSISDEGILDFAFGDYGAGTKMRRLRVPFSTDVSGVMLTRQILVNIVKASRECISAHPVELFLEATSADFHPEHPHADIAEETSPLAGNYELSVELNDDDWNEVLPDGCNWWTFRFDDMPDAHLEYMRKPPNGEHPGLVRIYFRRHCKEPSFSILRSRPAPAQP